VLGTSIPLEVKLTKTFETENDLAYLPVTLKHSFPCRFKYLDFHLGV
jgi:hypothetical protein